MGKREREREREGERKRWEERERGGENGNRGRERERERGRERERERENALEEGSLDKGNLNVFINQLDLWSVFSRNYCSRKQRIDPFPNP